MELPKEAYLFRAIVRIDGKVTYRFSVVGDDNDFRSSEITTRDLLRMVEK